MRGSALRYSEELKDCVVLIAQYVWDTFGQFPGTAPSIWVHTYLQAHHLDLEFYDKFFKPGAYLETHARHLDLWHPDMKDRRNFSKDLSDLSRSTIRG